jgi:hypothetical protein
LVRKPPATPASPKSSPPASSSRSGSRARSDFLIGSPVRVAAGGGFLAQKYPAPDPELDKATSNPSPSSGPPSNGRGPPPQRLAKGAECVWKTAQGFADQEFL